MAETSEGTGLFDDQEVDGSTDLKLATLASLLPNFEQDVLLDTLIASDGSVSQAFEKLNSSRKIYSPRKRPRNGIGHQTSLSAFRIGSPSNLPCSKKSKPLTKKGQTLHLYAPDDIAQHSPCSIIHNFLSASLADDLLKELLDEAPTFESATFKLFDNVVQSPHTACFYVDSIEEQRQQTTEYLYNGTYLSVRFLQRQNAAS